MAAAETRVPDATKALAEREASMDGTTWCPDPLAQPPVVLAAAARPAAQPGVEAARRDAGDPAQGP